MPPGCSPSDIPGNTEADSRFEEVYNSLFEAYGKVLERLPENTVDDIVRLIMEREDTARDEGWNEGYRHGVIVGREAGYENP